MNYEAFKEEQKKLREFYYGRNNERSDETVRKLKRFIVEMLARGGAPFGGGRSQSPH